MTHSKNIEQKSNDDKKGDFITLEEFETKYNSDVSKIAGKIFIIPEHMKKGIEQGRKDVAAGRIFTLEGFEKKCEKYLKD